MIVVVTGAMAAGKSTVAQLIAERLPRAVHVRGDVFRRMVVSGRVEMGPDPEPEALVQLRLRPVHVVVLAPRADALAVRASARGKAGYGVWEAEELDRGLRETTPRLGLWLDTSEQTPEETVDEILARLEEARVRE